MYALGIPPDAFSTLVRVNRLETAPPDALAGRVGAFSTLVRVNRLETRENESDQDFRLRAFSTLVRVNRLETAWRNRPASQKEAFQYPRAGQSA